MKAAPGFYGPFPLDRYELCQVGGCGSAATHERLVESTVDSGCWIEAYLCDGHTIPPYPVEPPIPAMGPYEEVLLTVERKEWYLVMRNDRLGRRPQPEGTTAMRWAERWHRRSRDTVTGPLTVEVTDQVDDYFLRNRRLLHMRVNRLVDGQDHGLPPRLETTSNIVAIPKEPGPAVAVRADDPNSPPY